MDLEEQSDTNPRSHTRSGIVNNNWKHQTIHGKHRILGSQCTYPPLTTLRIPGEQTNTRPRISRLSFPEHPPVIGSTNLIPHDLTKSLPVSWWTESNTILEPTKAASIGWNSWQCCTKTRLSRGLPRPDSGIVTWYILTTRLVNIQGGECKYVIHTIFLDRVNFFSNGTCFYIYSAYYWVGFFDNFGNLWGGWTSEDSGH